MWFLLVVLVVVLWLQDHEMQLCWLINNFILPISEICCRKIDRPCIYALQLFQLFSHSSRCLIMPQSDWCAEENAQYSNESYINKMEQGAIDFEVAESQEIARDLVEFYFESAYQKEVFQKEFSQKFLSEMYHHFENAKATPESKFYTLFILKELVIKKDKKVIGLLSTSQTFFELLQKFALTTDPKKPLSEKGKTLFQNDKDGKYGNSFMRLLLELLMYMGTKWANTSKAEPTRFKKILMRLEEQNITMPKEFMYLPKIQPKAANKDSAEAAPQKPEPKEKKPSGSVQSLVRFVSCKIQEYNASLQEIEDVNELQQYINKSHKMFVGQSAKFNEFGEAVYSQEEGVLMEFLKVKGFLDQEDAYYQEHITRNEYDSFYNKIRMQYAQIFGNQDGKGANKNATGVTPGGPTTKQSVPPPPEKKMSSGSPMEPPKDPEIRKVNSINRKDSNQSQKPSSTGQKQQSQKANTKPILPNSNTMISNLFSRMESRSKSPVNGFRLVAESVEKEKKNIQAHPPRQKQNRAISGSRIAASTLTRTGMKSGSIFNNVPNSSPPYKTYEGEMVMVSKELEDILFDIKKEQGHKRFKIGNLRDRYPLFENESMQIGFKSEVIFEEYDGFNTFLQIELYFGNKTTRQIKELEISFEGDENTLIYTSPRVIKSIIDPQSQIKHEVMMVPLKAPFSFTNMKLYFECGSQSTHTTVALPNSIIKLTSHIEMEKPEFIGYWSNCTHIYKSQMCKLSHHFPPNTLKKSIPALQELSIDYSEFSISGNTQDYQLYCTVEIWEHFEGVLKISVRPDLTFVLQLAAIDPSEDAINYLRVYLQTLQLVLQSS